MDGTTPFPFLLFFAVQNPHYNKYLQYVIEVISQLGSSIHFPFINIFANHTMIEYYQNNKECDILNFHKIKIMRFEN